MQIISIHQILFKPLGSFYTAATCGSGAYHSDILTGASPYSNIFLKRILRNMFANL